MKFKPFLLSLVVIAGIFSGCVADRDVTDNDSIDNHIPSNTESQAFSELDIYENPYMSNRDESDTSDYELYWELRKNGIDILANVCRDMSEKHWENIKSKEGFIEDFCDYGVYPTEEEKEKFLFTVTGSVDCLGQSLNVMVIIALSEDNPQGEISRVLYPGTREWHHVSYGYDETEIVDAYNVDFWKCMTAY